MLKTLVRFIVAISLAGISLSVAFAEEKVDKLSVIQTLKSPLRLTDIPKSFGYWSQGHGPYVWYYLDSTKDEEVWVFLLPDPMIGTKDVEKSEVTFITIANSHDTDVQRIIWPEKLQNRPFLEVFKELYSKYKK